MADPISFAIATVVQIGISYLFPSEGPRLKDLKMSASTYGAAIPWVFGLTRVPGNMIWSMDIKEHKKKKGMGKGGFSNQYTYSCTFAMGLCKGPITSVRRVWADGKLIYDIGAASNKYRLRFYLGDEEQVPDSAIAADLGDDAPAFRGLAYILFDDISLSDFGNRIPQVTVEVLAGSSERTVAVTALKDSDGIGAFEPDYVQGQAAFDFQRGYGYVRKGSELRQIGLRDGRMVQAFTEFGFETGDLATLLCAGREGSVMVARGPVGAAMSVDRLDPFSMQSVATSAPVPAPAAAASAMTSDSIEYLLAISAGGDATLLKALDLSTQWSLPLGGTAAIGAFRVCGRDADASGQPIFYALMAHPGAGSLFLSKVEGAATPVQTDVFTLTGAGLEPCGAVWDSANPGVILFWRDGGQAHIAKWSEDTHDLLWSTPIAGCPDTFSSQTQLLGPQLGWVFDGALYVINTITGEMISKDVDAATGEYVDANAAQVDWSDYLSRYPAVQNAYYNSGGWAFTASPEAYAQYDYYENGGQTAGRTLTYVGAGQGGGYALGDSYAGESAAYQAYDSTQTLLTCLDGIEGLVKLTDVAAGVSVGTIVQRMLQEGGLPASMTDLSVLYNMPIRGYGWASGTDIKNILDEMRRLFLFDLVERDGVLVAISRADPDNGLPPANEVIKQDALGSSGEDATDFWQETRVQEADLPASVTLAYMNVDADFETATARSARISNPIPVMFSRQQVAMEINVVLRPAEAKAQVNRILYAQWLERTKHETRLPWSYLNLDPADVIEVRMNDGRVYQDRLHQIEIGADFALQVEGYAADSGAYDAPIASADGGSGAGGQSVPQAGLALPLILNTPLLRDQDDQGGAISLYYTGVGNAAPTAYAGAGLYRSSNNIDYDLAQSYDSDTEWGVVVGKLPPASMGPFALDWKTKLIVQPSVSWFDLESITDDELWNGANLCVVGDEVIQFRDAVKAANGTWELTNLLRGRRGTEYACDNHKAGERFVFLSNATIAFASDSISARGQTRFFRAVAAGRTVQESATLQLAYEPRDLMPYAPSDIRLERGTGEDVTVTWARRTRLGGNLQDATGSVPLSERFERYEAYVLAAPFAGDPSRGNAPTSYLRRYENLATPSFTYTALEQGDDGYSPFASDLHVVIYQLSDAVGRGFPATRTIRASDLF